MSGTWGNVFSSREVCKEQDNFVNTIHCPVKHNYGYTCEICWRNSSWFECFQRDDRGLLETKTFTRPENTAERRIVHRDCENPKHTMILVQVLDHSGIFKNRAGQLDFFCKDLSYFTSSVNTFPHTSPAWFFFLRCVINSSSSRNAELYLLSCWSQSVVPFCSSWDWVSPTAPRLLTSCCSPW